MEKVLLEMPASEKLIDVAWFYESKMCSTLWSCARRHASEVAMATHFMVFEFSFTSLKETYWSGVRWLSNIWCLLSALGGSLDTAEYCTHSGVKKKKMLECIADLRNNKWELFVKICHSLLVQQQTVLIARVLSRMTPQRGFRMFQRG